MWVADYNSKSRDEMNWLDPRRAFFITRTSPMGFNFAAVATPLAGALEFTDMGQHVLAKLKK
jgi:copper chaperone NosL